MSALIDRIGQRYSRLLVTGRAPNYPNDNNARWHCTCDCGKECIAYGQDLARGKFKSCGCLNAERIRKHGMCGTRVYAAWAGMLTRCNNPNDASYHNYGGRGIKVSEEWHSFETFYADMGDPPPDLSLERIRNNEGYCKDNCKWATMKEQLNNRRINNHIAAFGKTQTVAQWAEETGLSFSTISNRISQEWPAEDALTKPPQPGKALKYRKSE